MIFEQLIAIGFMSLDKGEWKTYVVPEIKNLIEKYRSSIKLKDIGFPQNWEQILLSLAPF